ncbi:hypothetical protein CASFOL_042960 [Castilleja foliolosa]|uniref:Uncharacterized protein n=1 Tax=Castilleja foliolosa TaxID=1961234 RepID=A0ABD3B752_9LAMI
MSSICGTANSEIFKELNSLKIIQGCDPNHNDICFSDVSKLSNVFPSVEMVFDKGHKFLLSPENYLFMRITYSGLPVVIPINFHNRLRPAKLTWTAMTKTRPKMTKAVFLKIVVLAFLGELVILSLSFNRFNGEIPTEIGSLSMLKYLYLGFNNFKGSIPKEIGKCTSLNALDLHDNQLTGHIPKQIGNCTSLKILYLRDNFLTGSMVYIVGCCARRNAASSNSKV